MLNDDFFRLCWLTLKRSKPRIRKFMDEIEFAIAGAGRVPDKSKAPKKELSPNANKPEEPEYEIV